MNMAIGEQIKKLRKQQHMTQKQLAKESGIAEITIRQYEAGKYNPKPDAVMKLCVGLNCKITDIIDDETQKYYRMFDNINTKPVAFDNAIQKFLNKEDLTYEEEDAITKYVESEQFKQEKEDIKQIAQKAYDYISFMHSHSFASSEEELQENSQIESTRKKDNNIHKYDGSIRINHNLSQENIETLKEINIIHKKIESGEQLNENEIHLLNDYNQKQDLALKHLKETLKSMQKYLKPLLELQPAYEKLNDIGQKEAVKRIEELTEIPRYTKPDPPQD